MTETECIRWVGGGGVASRQCQTTEKNYSRFKYRLTHFPLYSGGKKTSLVAFKVGRSGKAL